MSRLPTLLTITLLACVKAPTSNTNATGGSETGGSETGLANPNCALPAFPGAEGYGACATGGRGGRVVYVTTLAAEGEGSLSEALSQEGARTILFKVSGVIQGVNYITHGNVTIAGQSSPGGVILRGLICDNVYDDNDCNNVIVRHLRSRPGDDEQGSDDALRMDGAQNIMLDHLSLEHATDEQLQISRTSNLTVQRSIFGEALGDHYGNSGVLINYSKTKRPLDHLSLHHNAWIRIGGRYPEMSCEENSDGHPGTGTSNCAGVTRSYEVANNVYFDALKEILYNGCSDTNAGNDEACGAKQPLRLNIIGNVMLPRAGSTPEGRMAEGFLFGAQNKVYWSRNEIRQGGVTSDGLPAGATSLAAKLEMAPITYADGDTLANVRADVGAYPLDPMDRRLVGYLSQGVDSTAKSYSGTGDPVGSVGAADSYSFDWSMPKAAPVDSDSDGMPDAFENAHGLNPSVDDHNGNTLSTVGYTNLEVYLNALATQR